MIRRLLRVLDAESGAALRRTVIGAVATAVLQGIGFVLLVPILTALLGPEPSSVWPWLVALAGVTVLGCLTHWDSQMAGYRAGSRLSRDLHHALGDHVAGLPLGWFTTERTGRLAHLAGVSVIEIMNGPAHLVGTIVTGLVTPPVVLVGMAFVDWRDALAAAITAPLAALTYRLTGRLAARADRAADAANAEAGERVIEFARAQPVLRAFRRTVDGHRLLDDALVAQRDAGLRVLLAAAPAFAGFVLVIQLAVTIVLLVGTWLALGGSVTAPVLIALLVLAVRFVEPMIAAADLGASLRMAHNALDRVEEVLAAEPLPEPSSPREPADPADTGVELRDVHFAYEPGRPVLDGVSLRVPPRTMTALVGPSGSGKTTVTRLVARFFDVDAGSVTVGGVDVREMATPALMSRLSLVFQDVYLFEGTVAENVRLARPDATDAQLDEVARLARVDEILERLPDGWDTRVGEGGATLSGGERQRVSIARALLKDAPVVLLDEATAALDAENEAAVTDALAALARDRTVLVIAHRLSTIAGADQIAVLADGRVEEVGSHDELLARDGRYARFWSERSRAAGWRLVGGGTA